MSRVTRRKHVLKEMMEDDYELPTGQQKIVRVVSSRGNNLHEVESDETECFLVSMPMKFRNNVWVKRGDFVLVMPIQEGAKVKAEICKILTTQHIKEYTKAGIWPKGFTKQQCEQEDLNANADADNDSDSTEFVVRNMNRPPTSQYVNDKEDDSDDSDTETSDEN